ncbi:MAG TPA: TonB family protein [Methylotenera sp.]|nr:TonB family protein [Methylotenera sp.]HPV44195.1 TonB family protein [Methylotenera sp.]
MSAALKQTEMVPLATLAGKVRTVSAISVAIWVSILIHVVILSIKFQPELRKLADRMPSLDVVLVNAKTKPAPDKAELLAQANLDRGGNTEANRKMKTALPSPKEQTTEVKLKPNSEARSAAKSAKLKAQEAREQKRVDDLEKQAQELLTQINSSKKIESNPTQNAASAEPEQGEQKAKAKALDRADLIAASLEMDRLQAQIAKQQDEYQKRPKRKFIGARTKEYRFAMYVESWRQKVERIGNMNYPEAARAQKLYGQLRMTVSIKADGTLESVVIDQASPHEVLNEAAKRIVELAAPYAVFPEDIKKDTDILSITRTWTFTQEDALQTE